MADKDLKTYLSEIPQLKGEENLAIWDMMLCDILDLYGRLHYLKDTVPEPVDKESEEWTQWHRERTMVRIMLNGTIVKVIPILELHGWTRNEKDPKATYEIIHRAIGKVSDDALPDLMRQYSTISRTDFDSYKRFVTKLQELRTKLAGLGVTMSEKAHMLVALNGIRDTYPDDFRFWVRDLEKGDLKLDNLMMELSNKAAKELSNGSFTQLRITPTPASSNQQIRNPRAENKVDSIDQGNQNRTQRGQRTNQPPTYGYKNSKNKECPGCHLRHWKGWKQCSRCNICHTKPVSDFCFLDNENEAPNWFKKLRKTTPTTATSQISGISAPVNRETTHTAIRNKNEDLVWTASGTSLTSIQKDF